MGSPERTRHRFLLQEEREHTCISPSYKLGIQLGLISRHTNALIATAYAYKETKNEGKGKDQDKNSEMYS